MTSPAPRPEIIERLANGAYSAFAMLAGMQLDLFSPLKGGPIGTEQIANALVDPIKVIIADRFHLASSR